MNILDYVKRKYAYTCEDWQNEVLVFGTFLQDLLTKGFTIKQANNLFFRDSENALERCLDNLFSCEMGTLRLSYNDNGEHKPVALFLTFGNGDFTSIQDTNILSNELDSLIFDLWGHTVESLGFEWLY